MLRCGGWGLLDSYACGPKSMFTFLLSADAAVLKSKVGEGSCSVLPMTRASRGAGAESVNQVLIDPGSTQARSRFDPGSTQVRPRFDPGSTQVRSRFDQGSIQGRHRFDPGSIKVRARFDPGSTQVPPRFAPGEPGSNHALARLALRSNQWTQDRTGIDLGVQGRPTADPGSTQYRTRANSGSSPKYVGSNQARSRPKQERIRFEAGTTQDRTRASPGGRARWKPHSNQVTQVSPGSTYGNYVGSTQGRTWVEPGSSQGRTTSDPGSTQDRPGDPG